MSDEATANDSEPLRQHLARLLGQLDRGQLEQLAVASDLLQSEGEITMLATLQRLERKLEGLSGQGRIPYYLGGRTTIQTTKLQRAVTVSPHFARFESLTDNDHRAQFAPHVVVAARCIPDHEFWMGERLALTLQVNQYDYGRAPLHGEQMLNVWTAAEFPSWVDHNNHLEVRLGWHGQVEELDVTIEVALEPIDLEAIDVPNQSRPAERLAALYREVRRRR